MDANSAVVIVGMGCSCIAATVMSLVAVAGLWWVMTWAMKRKEAFAKCLATTVADLGLDPAVGGVAAGTVDGVPVVIDKHWVQRGRKSIRLTRIRTTGGPIALRISGEGLGTVLSRLAGESDVLVGDPAFDDRVRMTGEPADVVRSRMDEATRAAVLAAIQRGAWYADGAWTYHLDPPGFDAGRLTATIRILIAASRALQPGSRIPS